MSVFASELVDFEFSAPNKTEAIRQLASKVVAAGRGTDINQITKDVLARDELGTPQVDGVAIPHARSSAITKSSVAVARIKSGTTGVVFDESEGPAEVLFMILVPDSAGNEHIDILSGLARRLMDPDFTSALRTTTDATALVKLLNESGT